MACRSSPRPTKATAATTTTAGTNQAGHRVGQTAGWAPALRCASPTSLTIRARTVSPPTRSARHDQGAGAVHGSADQPVACRSSRPAAARPSASTRRRRSPPRARDRRRGPSRRAGSRRRSPGRTSASGIFLLIARGTGSRRAPRRRQIEQRADGGAGALASPQLQHLPQRDQRDDHGRRLEVERHASVRDRAARRGNRSGAHTATKQRDHAEEVRHRHAEADQREHVGVPVGDRRDRAREERPARPTARPASPARTPARVRRRPAESFPTTINGAESAAPIQNRRVMSASSGLGASSPAVGSRRLQRHPAQRAGAWPIPHDLRVHRAGPGLPRCAAGEATRRGGWARSARRAVAAQIGPRVLLELGAAPRTAEEVASALRRWRARARPPRPSSRTRDPWRSASPTTFSRRGRPGRQGYPRPTNHTKCKNAPPAGRRKGRGDCWCARSAVQNSNPT